MSSRTFTGRPSGMFVFVILLICALSVFAVVWMISAMIIPPHGPLETTAPTPATDAPETTGLPSSPETSAPSADTTAAPDVTTAPSDTTAEPAVTTEPPPPIITLPKAETPVGDDYFKSILFIGDSRSQGLSIATGGGYGATFYADRGLSIDSVGTKQFLVRKQADGSSKNLSITEALTADPHKGKIYIWLGLNELGWRSADRFETAFRTQLTAVKTACPDAEIVIMSILPVGRSAVVIGVDSSAAANARVIEYNDILYRLAEEFGTYYLNCYEAFADAEGYLPNGYASDGIHLVRDQNLALCDYIRSHPVP